MCESWQKDDDKLTFIVVELAGYQADKDDVRHMVGDVNCFFNDPDDPLDNVEVEVMIAEPTARRKGFASEALELIMSYCVRELGVKGFRAQILRKNEGSKRLFERLGFRFAKAIDVFEEEVWVRGSSPSSLYEKESQKNRNVE
jgi:RimJ/RimL family protein N-acetyltransferase